MKRILLLFTCSLIAILTAQILLYPPPLSAVLDGNNWSWTSGTPKVSISKYNNEIPYDLCPYSYGTVEVTYLYNYKNICLFSSDKFKFGVYYENGRYIPVAGFGYENITHEITGLACYHPGTCVYNEKTDSLITRVSYGNTPSTIVIYDHFISRITPYIDYFVEASIPTIRLKFDATNPQFVFSEVSGYNRPLGGFGVSKNGRYIIAEIMHYGFVLIDTEGYKIRRISNFSAQYFMGSNPTIDPTVSNDGKTVVIAGINAGFEIITVNDTCGDWSSEHDIIQRRPLAIKCEILPLSLYTYVNRFKHAFRPRFSDDGGEFTIFANSDVESYFLVISADGYESKTMDYIALGDSFSSGEGESDDTLYKVGTNTPTEKCHLSLRSYPYLIARNMNIDPFRMASVACSGATTFDVLGNNSYSGQGKRLNNYSKIEASTAKAEALLSFIPGDNPQIDFISRYKPKLATIGIGGNDINLVKKLTSCITNPTCDWVRLENRSKTASEIINLFPVLIDTYSKLIESSPSTRFFAINYPKIINQENDCRLIGIVLNKTERQFANETITYINKTIEAAAKRAGIGFINIEDAFGDSVLCGKTEPVAMNSLRFGDDTNPIFDKLIFKIIGSESFHPNPIGHQLEAKSITDNFGNLFSYNYCLYDRTVCPNKNIMPPEPSEYWGFDKSDKRIYKSKNMATINQKKIDISIEDGSLAADQLTTVEIHSDPIEIGSYNTNKDGGFSLSFSIPESLEYGFHTLHVYSKTISGELIDTYQIFEYQEIIPIILEPPIDNVNITSSIKSVAHLLTENEPNVNTENNGIVLGDSSNLLVKPGNDKIFNSSNINKLSSSSVYYNSIITIVAVAIISTISVYIYRKII